MVPKFDLVEFPAGTDIERAFEERAEKILTYLFEREMLDSSRYV